MVPEIARELEQLGFPGLRTLPVTVVDGAKAVSGFDVPALKEALNIAAEAPRWLTAPELLEKYRIFFEGAKRAVLQIPDEKLDWVTPENQRRRQTLRQLAFHLFDRPDVCMDAAMIETYTREMCHEYEHLANNYRTSRDLVNYADAIFWKLEKFLTHKPDLTETVVETYFGPKTVCILLNMALVGTGLRIKQTYYFLRVNGIEPQNAMRDEDFAGVAVPRKIFG
ncbi:MAG: hypothetical protein HYY78_05090 [Betaproteobacteria bacterium]|nr:hypothetical protein [Betaproteobacteria bacterium]